MVAAGNAITPSNLPPCNPPTIGSKEIYGEMQIIIIMKKKSVRLIIGFKVEFSGGWRVEVGGWAPIPPRSLPGNPSLHCRHRHHHHRHRHQHHHFSIYVYSHNHYLPSLLPSGHDTLPQESCKSSHWYAPSPASQSTPSCQIFILSHYVHFLLFSSHPSICFFDKG